MEGVLQVSLSGDALISQPEIKIDLRGQGDDIRALVVKLALELPRLTKGQSAGMQQLLSFKPGDIVSKQGKMFFEPEEVEVGPT